MITTAQFIVMKLRVLTTSHTTDNQGWRKLEESLKKFNYEYTHILHPFSFGHQLPVIRDWCLNNRGSCTHILYTDCFDTIAYSGPEEVEGKFPECKMLISAEKACYPHPSRATDYPETSTPWKYVNGGGWMVELEYFLHLCQKERLDHNSHDQVWLMDSFLRNQDEINIDNNCEIFQTIAFSHKEEWVKGGQTTRYGSQDDRGSYLEVTIPRFQNIGTQSFPVFFHGNGHTDMQWLY